MGIPLTNLPAKLRAQVDPDMPQALLPGVTPEAREKAVAKNEREIQRDIANLLRQRGIWHVQSRMDRKTSNTVGTPDFLFPHRSRWVAWEVKCPWSPRLRPEQAEARDAILRQGGVWQLITSCQQAREHLAELEAN